MNRRGFINALAGLPFVGRFVKRECPQCGSVTHYGGPHIDVYGPVTGSFVTSVTVMAPDANSLTINTAMGPWHSNDRQ